MKKAFLSLVVIFITNTIGLYNGWYHDFFWFDMTLHFLGGFFVAMLLSQYLREYLFEGWRLKNFLVILGVVSFMGVSWEFSEYIANLKISPILYDRYGIRTYFMGDLDDTMNDLLMDILGAGSFALILHSIGRRKAHKI